MLNGVWCSGQPAPPSKSAIKRAKALARAEKKAQEKAARAAARKLANGKAGATSSAATSQSPSESPKLASKPLDEPHLAPAAHSILDETVPPVTAKIDASKDARRAGPPQLAPQAPPTSFVAAPAAQSVQDTKTSAPPPPSSYPQPRAPAEKPPAMANGYSTADETAVSKPEAVSQDAAERAKKLQSVFTRVLWTFIMIGGFIGTLNCLYLGSYP